MARQRILITGGAGFIGSHTADALLQQGKQVIILDNLFSGHLENLPLNHPNLEFIEGDVLEYPLLYDLIVSCDAVLHLAAIASVPMTIEEPIYSFQVNAQGLLHVLQAVHQSKQPIRVVYASSAAVYGEVGAPPCYDDQLLSGLPLSPYALHKMNNEEYASLYERLHGVSSLGMRYFNAYGSRQDPNSPYSGVMSRFMDAYKKETALTIFGDGEQSRDFIHISDIVKANVLALESDYAGALNIATGKPETLRQLIQYMETVGGAPATVQFEPARAGDIKVSYAAVKKAEQFLGFKAKVPLQQGIKMLLDSV